MDVHILNGDSLKERFPKSLSGDIIVARECMVDGPVNGQYLEEIFETRADLWGQFTKFQRKSIRS